MPSVHVCSSPANDEDPRRSFLQQEADPCQGGRTRAAKAARVSGDSGRRECNRKRRDCSRRLTGSRPQEAQMETALVDQALWKLMRGPTWGGHARSGTTQDGQLFSGALC